jgi:hypothetical protein
MSRDRRQPEPTAQRALTRAGRGCDNSMLMRRFAILLVVLLTPFPAAAQDDDDVPDVVEVESSQLPRRLVNKSDGIRLAWPFLSLAVSPTDPNVMYMGSREGYVFATKDGGDNWMEQRVRVERGKFVGAIRPTGTSFYKGSSWDRLRGDYEPGDVFRFGDTGYVDRFSDSGKPSSLLSLLPTSKYVDGASFERNFFSSQFKRRGWNPLLGGGGGGGDSRLGVGLRAGSKYLSLALRRKRGWAIGINIKQTLTLKAGAPTAVFWLSINPEDPNDVFAATRDGLLRTTDGGDSWPTVLTGATANERTMSHVLRNPHDPNNVWVSSNSGMFISNDGGNTFSRIIDARLAQYTCLWTTIHPKDPNRIYIGTTSGMFYSADGGRNFSWVWIQPWPAQNRVRRIAVDPENADRVLIGTDDGLFVSDNVAAEKWDRGGGLQFTGLPMRAVASSGKPGHFLAGDNRDMWESFDGGKTWQIIYFGAVYWDVRLAFFAPGSQQDIWLLTTGEVLKLDRKPSDQISPTAVRTYREMVASEPTISQAIHAARLRGGVYRGDLSAYRRDRSRWRGYAPKLNADLLYRDVDVDARRAAVQTNDGGVEPRDQASNELFLDGLRWRVLLKWDLSQTIFSGDEAPFGRVFGVTKKADLKIRDVVADLYLERRRTQLAILTDVDADARTQIMRALSMEELTAHLNYLTGDLFPAFKALGGIQ